MKMYSTLATTIQNGSRVVIGIPLKISAQFAATVKKIKGLLQKGRKKEGMLHSQVEYICVLMIMCSSLFLKIYIYISYN